MDTSQQILIVDDNPTNRRILVKSLGKEGYLILEAADGFQAVDMANAKAPDLILLDIMMPQRDGFEVCRILKAQESTASIPVIFLTSKSDSEDVEKAFCVGGCDYVTKPVRISEVKARVSVHLQLRQAQREADERNKQLEEMSKIVANSNIELARLARVDPLTKLLNRRAWEEAITLEHDRCGRSGSVFSIVMLDVDHFKSFNDSQGHQAGDDCLVRVAECLQSTCRSTDVVGRYGGEEFVVLAPETDEETVLTLAERIRQAIFDLNIPHVASLVAECVTVSLGVAIQESGSWEDVLKTADEALYAAKETGRNTVCLHSAALLDRKEPLSEESCEAPGKEAPTSANQNRVDVLIVDDNQTNRTVCRRSLERAGYDIREAADGRAALDAVSRERPCIILMDVIMPVMDGLECTRRLKENAETRDIPVIIISARADASDIQAGLEAGADEYLTKPIRPAELALRVRSMVKRQQDRQELLLGYEVRGEQTGILNLLLDLCRTLGATEDLDETLEQTITTTAALTGCRRISIMLPDAERKALTVAKSTGMDEETVAAIKVPIVDCIAGRVLESGRAIVINSEREYGSNTNPYDSMLFSSTPLICAALGAADRTIGVLSATDSVGGQPFESRELHCVEMIAGIAGTAIHGILTRRARDAIMVAFAQLAEQRDDDTSLHVDRVTQYCLILAEDLRSAADLGSQIDDEFVHDLERAVPLHDIGKIAIPDSILLKPGRLTENEMTNMRTHAEIGGATIRSVLERAPDLSMLTMAEEIATSHHEWYDGTGYPERIQADQIPLCARIVGLADVYDALTTKRPYKEAMTHDESVAIILKSSGTQFDPTIVRAFLRRASDFETLAGKLSDSASSPQPMERAALV